MVRLRQIGVTLLALLSLGGCIFTFNNPVQVLDGGSISGVVTLVNPAIQGQSPQGGTVSVLWSGGLTLTLDSTGKFAFLALPDGTYNLSTFVPKPASNDYDTVSLIEGLVLPVSAGQIDALNLGSVALQPSGYVTGTVTSGQAGAVVAAFFSVDGGPRTYEGYATTTDGGAYSLLLPAGDHFIAVSDSQNSVVASLSLPATKTVTQNFDLDAGEANPMGLLQGNLVFGGALFGASAPASTVDPILSGVTYAVFDPKGQMIADGGLNTGDQGSSGAPFTLELPAGQPLDVLFFFPTNVGNVGDEFKPLVLRALPFIAGQTTYLAQVTWLPVSTFVANGFDAGTGDTYTDAGSVDAGGGNDSGLTWQLIAYIDAGDGTALSDLVPLPVPLLDGGGYGHRLTWVANGGLFTADDSSGSFGSTQTVPGSVPSAGTLTGTFTPSQGDLLAWVDAQNILEAAYCPAQGSPTTVTNPGVTVPTGNQAVAVLGGSQSGAPGVFALLTGGVSVVPILFTGDNQAFVSLSSPSFFVDAGTVNQTIIPNTIAAASCHVADLAGQPGFCFVSCGSYSVDGGTPINIVFTGAFLTSGNAPQFVGLQDIAVVPQTSPVALATLPTDATGFTPVVIAYQNGSTPMWAQFSSLATSPTAVPAPNPAAIQVLLPYSSTLALSQGTVSGIDSTFLTDAGSSLVQPLQGVHATPLLHGYSDPGTGAPTILVSSQFASPPQLMLYQLPLDGGG